MSSPSSAQQRSASAQQPVAVLDRLLAELLLVRGEEVLHAVGLADVVEVVDGRPASPQPASRQTRVRDRRRRQALEAVRVVRRAAAEVRARERARPLDAQPVADRRVDRERHPAVEPVVDTAEISFRSGATAGLALDDRRDREHVVRRPLARLRRPQVDRLPALLERLDLPADEAVALDEGSKKYVDGKRNPSTLRASGSGRTPPEARARAAAA